MLWIFLGVTFTIALIIRLFQNQKYWTNNNVKQGFPIPIFGDNITTLFRFESFAEFNKRCYLKYSDVRYFGIYKMTRPVLLIRDPDLIKQIGVKDFDYFTDHRPFLPEDSDPLWSKNLFALRGDKWRDMRSTLSPAFTSSKMRSMFYLMNECAEQYASYYGHQESAKIELEMKESFTRYANDVIATCAFGLKCDSLKDTENDFFIMGKEATNLFEFKKMLKISLFMIAPKVHKLLGLRFFSEQVNKFFTTIVSDTIKVREEQHIIRPDMLNLLMEARRGRLTYEEDSQHQEYQDAGFATVEESHVGKAVKQHVEEITDLDITAQALIFFFAGFDTVSTLMSFMAYELAINPDIQGRLILEVDEVFNECKGKLTYEHLAGMKYMDMIISETLRKWPPAVAIDRICVKPYTIQPTRHGESPVHFKVGDAISIPTIGIHHDPKFYREPERFNPDRFNDDNKHNITPSTYIPFGVGPRNCIGSRFALMETKTVFFHILSKFEIIPIAKTDIPMKISKKSFTISPENGNWLALKKRRS